jgi:hypothetical protein
MRKEIQTAGQASRLPAVKSFATNWIAQNEGALLKRAGDAATQIIKRNQQELFNQQMENLENSTDPNSLAEMEALIDNHTGSLIRPELAGLMKTAAQQKKTAQFQEIAIGGAIGDAVEEWRATGNLKDALEAIEKDPRVSQADKQEAGSEVKTRITNLEAAAKLEVEKADTESVEKIDGWINNDELVGITDRIKALPLTETRKREELAKANAHTQAINSGKLSPMRQTNDSVYWDMRTKIEENPDSVSLQDVRLKVGKGLSISDYDTFKEMLQPDSPLKKPASTRAQAAIQRIRSLEQRFRFAPEEIEEEIQIEDKYLRISNDLDEFILKNPDATDEQIDQKTKQLLRPVAEQVTLGFFERLFSPKKEGGIPILSPIADIFLKSESQELVAEKIDALKERGVWQNLNKEEKADVKKAFESRRTVQDILDRL